MVVVGDSTCLENKYLSSDSNCNEDFANDAVNWLLDRAQIMGGVSHAEPSRVSIACTRPLADADADGLVLTCCRDAAGRHPRSWAGWYGCPPAGDTGTMHPRNTRILVALAVGLFAFIYFFESRSRASPVAVDNRVLPGLKAAESEEASRFNRDRPGDRHIRAERHQPAAGVSPDPQPYPAQPRQSVIDELLKRLEGLTYQRVITARDLKSQPKADQEYGFDSSELVRHNLWNRAAKPRSLSESAS